MKAWRQWARFALFVGTTMAVALIAAFALTGDLHQLADAPVRAQAQAQCGTLGLPVQEYENAQVTFTPDSGTAGSFFDVELANILANNFSDEPVEALWEWDGTPGEGEVVGSGTIPEGSTGVTFGAEVPDDAQPDGHTVTVCWKRNIDETWYYKDAAFDVPEPTPTPSPTPTPTPTPTTTPTPTPTPPAGVMEDAGPAYAILARPRFIPYEVPEIAGPAPDYRIANIEVTQSQQCLDNTAGDTDCADNELPLVAHRLTWVRVYVGSGTLYDVPDVPVRLNVSRNGVPWRTLNGITTASPFLDRDDIEASANFLLLCTDCDDGDVLSFQAEVDPDGTLDERDDANNLFPTSGTLDLTVHERESFHILALPMDYQPPTGTSGAVADSEVEGQAGWLIRAYPVPMSDDPVVYEIGPAYVWNQAFDRANVINDVNTAYVTAGTHTPPDKIVVFVPAATGYNNGVSDPLWAGGQGVVVLVDVGYAVAGARARVVAHEIAHNFGRRHPCTNNAQDDPDWPYTDSGVAGLDYEIQETGMDTSWEWMLLKPGDRLGAALGSILVPSRVPVVRPHTQIEMMQGGHCGFVSETNSNEVRWVAPYTYQQLYCALSPNGATAQSCWQGNAVAIGSIAEASAESITAAQNGVESVLVSGVINPDTTGDISSVYRLAKGTPNPLAEGEYCVELENEGTVVGSHCFDVSFDLPLEPTADQPSPFSIVLAWMEGTDRIVLRHGTDILDSVDVSASAPTVEVTAPSGDGLLSGTQTAQWQAEDPDGDPLLFTLHYSWDGGASFFPIVANISETSYQANVDDLPGGNDAFFRVIATDNTGNSGTGDSEHFQVATKPPVATILSPEDGSEYQIGDPVTLMGSAADKEDKTLPSEAYVWSSDRDGQIADRPTSLVAELSPGWHTITLEVRDSDGQKGSASVRIFVGIPTLVDVKPDVLNVASPQPVSTVTAHVEPPVGYDVDEVDTESLILLVGTATLSPTQATVGDFDDDELADLELTFDGQSFVSALPASPDLVMATVSGELEDGTPFQGHDVVEVLGAVALVAGWNQACYAGSQQGTDAALAPILNQVLAVYRLRDDGGHDRWFPGRPEVSTMNTVNPFEPLLILMSDDASWVQDVSAMSPMSADLVLGWNSVCYGGVTEPVDEASANMSANLSVLYTLSNQAWHRYVPSRSDITNISDLAHLTPVLALVTKEAGATWTFDLVR